MRSFEEAVLEVLRQLEAGEVMTYGEVAAEAGFAGAARAVGTLLRTSVEDLPWWRVVGAGGRIRTAGVEDQSKLLRAEGVRVVNGRVINFRF